MRFAMFLFSAFVLLPSNGSACEEHKKQTAAAPLSGDSLYHGTSRWRDPSGDDVTLANFRGHKVVLTMAYTQCTYTCPLVVAKLKEIEAAAGKDGKGYKIVVASFDPVRDNPERLKQYMKEKKLDPANWVFLSPKSDRDVRQLAAMLGVTYSKDKSGEYAHSNVISLLDGGGLIQERLEGIAADHENFVAKLIGK